MNTKNNNSNGWRDWLCAGAAVATAIFVGLIDFHNREPQPAAAVLLVLCGLMGFARPSGAWRWGVIAPLGIPVVYLAGCAMGFKPADAPQPNIFASLVALIPGLIGAYAGAFARRLLKASSN
jgi:hypothetical protein